MTQAIATGYYVTNDATFICTVMWDKDELVVCDRRRTNRQTMQAAARRIKAAVVEPGGIRQSNAKSFVVEPDAWLSIRATHSVKEALRAAGRKARFLQSTKRCEAIAYGAAVLAWQKYMKGGEKR